MKICFLPLLLAVMLAVNLSLQAQTPFKQYYDVHDRPVDDEAGAAYYKTGMLRKSASAREVYTDSVLAYYHPSGKLKGREFYSAKGKRKGPYVYYFENGNRMEEGTFREFEHVGRRTNWYPNGQMQRVLVYADKAGDVSNDLMIDFKLVDYWDSTGAVLVKDGNGYCRCTGGFGPERETLLLGRVRDGLRDSVWEGWQNDTLLFRETYEMHQLKGGVSFVNGQEIAYSKLNEMAAYSTGLTGLANFLQRVVKYPGAARKARLQGAVYVSFVVDTDGTLHDVTAVFEGHPLLAQEAVRAVTAMPRWQPGKHRGRLVKSRFVLPITFKLGA